jgi:hypothetical protein
LSDLLRFISDGIDIVIDDRSEQIQAVKIPYFYDSVIYPVRRRPLDSDKELPILLDNLARQTNLRFKVERQPAEIWFVTEATGN